MSAKERIAHLESLLERIRTRAAEPREAAFTNGHAPAALAVIDAASGVAERDAPISSHPAPSRASDDFSFDSSPPPMEVAALPSSLPPPAASDVDVAHAPPALDAVRAAAVSEAADPEHDVRESRARLVSPSRTDAFYLDHEEDDARDEAELHEAELEEADLDAAIPQRQDTLPPEPRSGPVVEADVEADVERAGPSSSSRPIAIEHQMSALDAGTAPLTPPPESGRQVSTDDASDYDAEFTGVRHASSFVQRDAEAEVGPHVVHPRLPSHADLAGMFTAAERFSPSTFNELLDATLAL